MPLQEAPRSPIRGGRIAIAGLGTVGLAVARARCGRHIGAEADRRRGSRCRHEPGPPSRRSRSRRRSSPRSTPWSRGPTSCWNARRPSISRDRAALRGGGEDRDRAELRRAPRSRGPRGDGPRPRRSDRRPDRRAARPRRRDGRRGGYYPHGADDHPQARARPRRRALPRGERHRDRRHHRADAHLCRSPREAARGFPANFNVAVALSLAGIGPDRTELEIWADPGLERNTHRIEVEADAARFAMTSRTS